LGDGDTGRDGGPAAPRQPDGGAADAGGQDGGLRAGPDLEVLPRQVLLFPSLAPSRRAVILANAGDAPLELREVAIVDAPDAPGAEAFRLDSAPPPVLVPSASSRLFIASRPPEDRSAVAARLEVRSNDPDEPTLQIRLRAEGTVLPSCVFEIEPRVMRFGRVEIGRGARRALTVRNQSHHDCFVASLELAEGRNAGFDLPDGPVRGRRLGPGETLTVETGFSPARVGPAEGRLELTVSSPTSPFHALPLRGEGLRP
jgi:hypothetical protein